MDVWILLVLAALSILSYLANLRWLRTPILVFSVIYLGIFRATFFSIFHVTGLLSWKVPQFMYNPSWWAVVGIALILGFLFGRIWCWYLCPFGALQELLYRVIPKKIKLNLGGDRKMRFIKYIFLAIIIVFFFSTAKINLSNYEPFTVLFSRSGTLFGWILVGFVLAAGLLVSRFWCRYFCLAGTVLGVISRSSIFRLKKTAGCQMDQLQDKEGPNRGSYLLKLLIAATSLIILLSLAADLVGAEEAVETIRKPVVAGAFYPADPKKLEGMIDGFLEEAEPPSVDGKVIALIAPHAGYIYSGSTAAYGFKLLKDREFDVVVVMAPSHHFQFTGASVYSIGDYSTPLGRVRVDRKLCDRLIQESERITYYGPAHRREHSLEVELPFLQRVLGDFSLVPIVMGNRSRKTCEELARALVEVLKDKRVLFIASTDMSHYHDYESAQLIDRNTLEIIERFSSLELLSEVNSGKAQLCGAGPVVVTMMAAKRLGADKLEVLKYLNSGDTAGDRSRVVGYCAAVLYKAEKRSDVVDTKLSEGAVLELLSIARRSIEAHLSSEEIPRFQPKHEELKRHGGAFVTLRRKGVLRGCIGNFSGNKPLHETVAEMAVASATRDMRFYPVSKEELANIEIEISALSPLKKIESIDEIELGVHGIYIVRGYQNGCYLPQVATETGWSKLEFLEHCSHDKAGLGKEGWKDADVYIFTAEVFGESDL